MRPDYSRVVLISQNDLKCSTYLNISFIAFQSFTAAIAKIALLQHFLTLTWTNPAPESSWTYRIWLDCCLGPSELHGFFNPCGKRVWPRVRLVLFSNSKKIVHQSNFCIKVEAQILKNQEQKNWRISKAQINLIYMLSIQHCKPVWIYIIPN